MRNILIFLALLLIFVLVKCVQNRPAYFAEQLYKSMKVNHFFQFNLVNRNNLHANMFDNLHHNKRKLKFGRCKVCAQHCKPMSEIYLSNKNKIFKLWLTDSLI